MLCNENCIHRGLGKNRGYLGCPETKAKFNFAAPKMRKYGQATVRMRRVEGGTELGLKTEKKALCSHPAGRVAILLPLRGRRVWEWRSLLPFSEVTVPTQQLLPVTLILPSPIPLME